MFCESRQLPKTLYAASALALVLGAGMVGDYVAFDMGIVPSAHAAQQAGGRGEKGAGPSGDVRGGGVKKGGSEGGRGGKSMKDVLAGEDDDSDRPDWAMGNKEPGEPPPPDEDSDRPDWVGGDKDLNTHRGDPNPTPGVTKGDDYGDLWVILRDDLGNPILDVNGNVQPILEDGRIVQLTDPDGDGKYELPAEYTDLVQEVEIGRSNVARSPERVITHSLDEALSKLDGLTYADDVMTDPSGRLTYVVDGVTYTIDSPLENLALYQALLDAAVDGSGNVIVGDVVVRSGDLTFTVPSTEVLDLAASLLAAGSDKTALLTVDRVVTVSNFLGVFDELTKLVATYTDYTGGADEYKDEQVWILTQTAGTETPDDPSDDAYKAEQVTLSDVVAFNTLPMTVDEGDDGVPDPADLDGITGFTQTADDALQVLEYIHANQVE